MQALSGKALPPVFLRRAVLPPLAGAQLLVDDALELLPAATFAVAVRTHAVSGRLIERVTVDTTRPRRLLIRPTVIICCAGSSRSMRSRKSTISSCACHSLELAGRQGPMYRGSPIAAATAK